MKMRSLTIDKIKLYDLKSEIANGNCPEDEEDKYAAWIRLNMKLLKAMFTKYSLLKKNKLSVKKFTFD